MSIEPHRHTRRQSWSTLGNNHIAVYRREKDTVRRVTFAARIKERRQIKQSRFADKNGRLTPRASLALKMLDARPVSIRELI